MLKQCFGVVLMLVIGLARLSADTIQLKDKAAISGKVLADKRDMVAVDIGYTVLVIPRNQISKVVKVDEGEAHEKTVASAKPPPVEKKTSSVETSTTPETHNTFYSGPRKSAPIRTVRDLVDTLGEAVVQVRTPSGLGSGFIVNEDAFLLTNFRV